jgi:2-dehydro-3-deoxyphosphooctonate aldolase (KDO 8-P synthase)
MHMVSVRNFLIGPGQALALIAGPCVIESEELVLSTAEFLKGLCEQLSIPLIFKSSYDKANRSSLHSFRGLGIEEGLRILEKVGQQWDLPVLTDIHSPQEAKAAAEVCDVLQIPAFLCRQTDLLLTAGQTGRVVNVKKGQFVAPWNMEPVVEKIRSTGNQNILLTERGCCLGYNNLVCDMRSIPIMQGFGVPVVFDATHSVQLPGAEGSHTGGERQFIPTLSAAAVGAGCNALFIETHPEPDKAKSDSTCQLPLKELKGLLQKLLALHAVAQEVGTCC